MSSEKIYYGWVSDWMELVLKKIAENRIGPTVATRWLFLTANTIYNSYQFITINKVPLDSQYWTNTTKGILCSEPVSYIASWVERSCQYAVPIIIRNYMNVTLSDAEVNELIDAHKPLTQTNVGSFNLLKPLISSYLAARDNDGWKNTFIFNGSLPNGANVIYADNSVNQDLRTLPQPNKWTPLSINGVTRNYLTPEWGSVNNGVLSETDFKELLDKTNVLYPSDTYYEKEMKDVFTVTNNLTDDQKMMAEFWAGGPGTVTPPGMFVVFLDIYIRSNMISVQNELKFYTILTNGLYQASITAWRLKRQHMQARPVQKIRQYQYDQPIEEKWNDKVLGQYWLPYQEPNFVTPPFPDFVSGHSTFGCTTAKLFSYMFENNLIQLKIPVFNDSITELLSPVLTRSGTQNFAMNNLFLLPDVSGIENDVPISTIIFNWSTWNEMGQSCGISRVYGGIHVQSSNVAGQYLGSMIGDKIWLLLKNI
jgi:hypothetical protein